MEPLIDRECLLQKYPGKGGWTYAILPEVPKKQRGPFGWFRVKGSIDDHKIDRYRLMPLSNGDLFLPVKAEIRKKIGKEAGDLVKVKLYLDDSELVIPIELLECLEAEPAAHSKFLSLTEGQKEEIIKWVFSAKKPETQVRRLVKTIVN
ncbi:MAG: YdeI/OmpD-associated family protein [Bacteroidota bacterium]|nr:YdeI/OmpD-associated family protein [Bacteroidota bacterium]